MNSETARNLQPLHGMRVLVTRAAQQSEEFVAQLESLGARVVSLPLIAFAPPDSWDALDEAIIALESFDWIVFASTNAVNGFASRLVTLAKQLSPSANTKIAVIGPNTGKSVTKHGWEVSFQPTTFVADDFVSSFPEYPHLSGKKILLPKTNIGRDVLAQKLSEAGANVVSAGSYKTVQPENIEALGEQILRLLSSQELDAITLASAQTARNLALAIGHNASKDLLDGVAIVTIGPETTRALQSCFPELCRLYEAAEYTGAGIAAKLCEIQQKRAH